MDIRNRLKNYCHTVNAILLTQPLVSSSDLMFLSSLVTISLIQYPNDDERLAPFVKLRDRYPGLVLTSPSYRTPPEDLEGLIYVSGHLGSGGHVVEEQDLCKVGEGAKFLFDNYIKDLHKQMMDLFNPEPVVEFRDRTVSGRILEVRDRMEKSLVDPFPCGRYVLLVGVAVNGGIQDPECEGLPGYRCTLENVDVFQVKTTSNQYQFGTFLSPNGIGVRVCGPLECRYGDDTNFGTTGTFRWYRKYGLRLIDPTSIVRVRLNWPVGIDL